MALFRALAPPDGRCAGRFAVLGLFHPFGGSAGEQAGQVALVLGVEMLDDHDSGEIGWQRAQGFGKGVESSGGGADRIWRGVGFGT